MRHNFPKFLTFIVAITLLISCKSDPNSNDDNNDTDTTMIADTIQQVGMDVDTTSVEEATIEVVYEDKAVQEAHEEIVKKYGIQWDFCTCVQKSDSVNTALMEASDAQFDAVMERSEYIDSKCKGLLIQPNATPEDRMKHENKVKKCLD
jgi:ABC-type transport system substrate-binding protein